VTNLTLESEPEDAVLFHFSPEGITCRTASRIRPGDALEICAEGLILLGEAVHIAAMQDVTSESDIGVHLIHRLREQDIERLSHRIERDQRHLIHLCEAHRTNNPEALNHRRTLNAHDPVNDPCLVGV
jgi:hypothetical protein